MFNTHTPTGFRRMATEALSTSKHWAETGQELAMAGSHRAKRFINKRPMTATCIGLGIGYLLGKLFSKRKAPGILPAIVKAAKRSR